jgi:hypothetical protein
MADIFKTHANRNILTDAAYAAGEDPMEYRSDTEQQSRVCVGPRQFDLANFRHKGEDKVLIAAHNRDYITAKVISGDEWEDFERKAGIDYSRHPDPWGDANALEQMTRHWLDVDSGSLPRQAMREDDYGWPSIEPKTAPRTAHVPVKTRARAVYEAAQAKPASVKTEKKVKGDEAR